METELIERKITNESSTLLVEQFEENMDGEVPSTNLPSSSENEDSFVISNNNEEDPKVFEIEIKNDTHFLYNSRFFVTFLISAIPVFGMVGKLFFFFLVVSSPRNQFSQRISIKQGSYFLDCWSNIGISFRQLVDAKLLSFLLLDHSNCALFLNLPFFNPSPVQFTGKHLRSFQFCSFLVPFGHLRLLTVQIHEEELQRDGSFA